MTLARRHHLRARCAAPAQAAQRAHHARHHHRRRRRDRDGRGRRRRARAGGGADPQPRRQSADRHARQRHAGRRAARQRRGLDAHRRRFRRDHEGSAGRAGDRALYARQCAADRQRHELGDRRVRRRSRLVRGARMGCRFRPRVRAGGDFARRAGGADRPDGRAQSLRRARSGRTGIAHPQRAVPRGRRDGQERPVDLGPGPGRRGVRSAQHRAPARARPQPGQCPRGRLDLCEGARRREPERSPKTT